MSPRDIAKRQHIPAWIACSAAVLTAGIMLVNEVLGAGGSTAALNEQVTSNARQIVDHEARLRKVEDYSAILAEMGNDIAWINQRLQERR